MIRQKRFATAKTRELALTFAGLAQKLQELTTDLRLGEWAKEMWESAQVAEMICQKISTSMVVNMHMVEKARLLDEAKHMVTVVMPTDEAFKAEQRFRELMTSIALPKTDFDILAHQAMLVCRFCNKQGEAAEACEKQRIFLQASVEPVTVDAPEGNCAFRPYEGPKGITLGERLRQLLADKDVRQKEMAADLGVSATCAYHYVANERRVPRNRLPKLAAVFGLTVEQLLEGVDYDADLKPREDKANRSREAICSTGAEEPGEEQAGATGA